MSVTFRFSRGVALTAFAVSLVLVGLRSRHLGSVVWAEDGTIFLQGALDHGIGAVVNPYAGYLHVAPRLLAWLLAAAPLQWFPMLVAGSTALVWAAVAAPVARRMLETTGSARVAFVGVLAVVCVPAAAMESVASLANLQFVLLSGLAVLLAADPTCQRNFGRALGLAGLVALSTPLAFAAAAPLAPSLLHWRAGRRRARIVAGVVLAGATVQAIVYATTASGRGVAPHGLAQVAAGRRFFVGWAVPPLLGGAPEWRCVAAVVTAAVLVLWRFARPPAAAPARDDCGSIAAVCARLAGAALALALASFLLGGVAARYFVAPTILAALWLGVIAFARSPAAGGGASGARVTAVSALRTLATVAAIGALSVLAVSAAVHFEPTVYRASGPDWSAGVAAARSACAGGATEAAVGVGPYVHGNSWGVVRLPCSRVRARE